MKQLLLEKMNKFKVSLGVTIAIILIAGSSIASYYKARAEREVEFKILKNKVNNLEKKVKRINEKADKILIVLGRSNDNNSSGSEGEE